MARRGKKPGSRKTGGRKRGTPNRASQLVRKLSASHVARRATRCTFSAWRNTLHLFSDEAVLPATRRRARVRAYVHHCPNGSSSAVVAGADGKLDGTDSALAPSPSASPW